jgi:hypothetical protein
MPERMHSRRKAFLSAGTLLSLFVLSPGDAPALDRQEQNCFLEINESMSSLARTQAKDAVQASGVITDPNGIHQIAMQKELELVHAIFGSDLDLAARRCGQSGPRDACCGQVPGGCPQGGAEV